MKVIKNNKIVLEVKRNHSDGLWDMPIYSQQKNTSFIMPKNHPGLHKHRNNISNFILSNAPKRLPSHKLKSEHCNLKINNNLFQNEMVKAKVCNKKST